jgi:energy-coupling factor transport system ATP-binding protein
LICDNHPAKVLTDDRVIKLANLKETSLFSLAKNAAISDPFEFVKKFISFDREARQTCQQ